MTIAFLFCLVAACAADEFELGTVSTIQMKDVNYALRVPKGYAAARGAPAIIFIHGSNMQGESYAKSLEVFRELQDWVLIAPTGPMKTGEHSFNHNPGDERYVAAVLSDVEKRLKLKLTRLYVGGHSQGAFLSHAVAAHLANRVDGVLAVSGGAWINPFHLTRKGGRSAEIPIAIVHAQDDPVVPFAVSVSIYDAYRKAKHEDVRLFAPNEGAHMFLRLPIIPALAWLELMNESQRETVAEILSKTDASKDPRTAWDAERMRRRLAKNAPATDSGGKAIRTEAKRRLAELMQRLAKAKKLADTTLLNDCWSYLANYGMLGDDGPMREVLEDLLPSTK